MNQAKIQQMLDAVFDDKPQAFEIARAISDVKAKHMVASLGFTPLIDDEYFAQLVAERIVQNRFSDMTFALCAQKKSAANADAQNQHPYPITGEGKCQVSIIVAEVQI